MSFHLGGNPDNHWRTFDESPPATDRLLEFWSDGHSEIKVGHVDKQGVVRYARVFGCETYWTIAIGLRLWREYKPEK